MKVRLKAKMNGPKVEFIKESYYINSSNGHDRIDDQDVTTELEAVATFGQKVVDLGVVEAVKNAFFETFLTWHPKGATGTPAEQALGTEAQNCYHILRGSTWLTARQHRKLAMKLWREWRHARMVEAKPAEEDKVTVESYTRQGKTVKGYTRKYPSKKV